MKQRELAALKQVLIAVVLRLRPMERRHPDGTPETPEEAKREVWDWLRLAAARPSGPAH
jgi:hypothetical protein